MKITKYVWVSQGVKIGETFDKEYAYSYMNSANEDWNNYCQECYDNYERPADNEIFIYEEEVEASEVKHEIEAQWIYDEENECFICHNCKSSALNNYRGLSYNSRFCPECGSRMTYNGIIKSKELAF